MPKESINKNIEVLAEDLSKAKLVGAEELIPLIAGKENDKLLEALEKFLVEHSTGKGGAGTSASSSAGTSTRASSAVATAGSDAGLPVGDSGDSCRLGKSLELLQWTKKNLKGLKLGIWEHELHMILRKKGPCSIGWSG